MVTPLLHDTKPRVENKGNLTLPFDLFFCFGLLCCAGRTRSVPSMRPTTRSRLKHAKAPCLSLPCTGGTVHRSIYTCARLSHTMPHAAVYRRYCACIHSHMDTPYLHDALCRRHCTCIHSHMYTPYLHDALCRRHCTCIHSHMYTPYLHDVLCRRHCTCIHSHMYTPYLHDALCCYGLVCIDLVPCVCRRGHLSYTNPYQLI